jgi:GGDEF domain-containing protein
LKLAEAVGGAWGVLGILGLGLVVGFVLGRRGLKTLTSASERQRDEVARSEAQGRELQRQLSRLRNEQQALSNLSRSLPGVVRDLNRSQIDARQIPRLVFQFVDSIFEPEQILLYVVRSPGEESEREQEIFLREHTGLAEVPPSVTRLRVGDGKIGWVAEHKIEMLAEDWLRLTRTDGVSMRDNHPSLKLDMIAPLVHHEEGREQLLGVLCVGAPAVRPRDEKLMLQLVSNLAAIAMINSRNVRKLSEQANHDGLTGLLNKRYFLGQKLPLLINNAEREAQRVGIFIFDIDHFKNYNDRNGHLAGDEALRGVAFIVAMPQTSGPEALRAAERVRAAMEAHAFPMRESQPSGRLTISGGVSIFPIDGTSANDLIRNADQALYQSKASGRNRVVLFRGVSIGETDDAPGGEAWMSDADSPLKR